MVIAPPTSQGMMDDGIFRTNVGGLKIGEKRTLDSWQSQW
jgi:hypothetical protein